VKIRSLLLGTTLGVDVMEEGMSKFWKIHVSGFQLSPKEIKKKVEERIERALERDG